MGLQGAGYCIECGERLETGHRFCPRCGTERWQAPATPAAAAPEAAQPAPGLRLLPWIYAAGAVYFLVSSASAAAYLLAPGGVHAFVADSGLDLPSLKDPAFAAAAVGFSLAAYVLVAALHAAAYFGLRARKAWGWVVAVLLAALWSLLLVGIPTLYLLMRPATRRAFGVG